MTAFVDEHGNTVRRKGAVTEVIEPGPQLQAEMAAAKAAADALAAKVAANRAALDALAIEARNFARGTTALTLAQLTAASRKQAEMLARMWFNERYGDE